MQYLPKILNAAHIPNMGRCIAGHYSVSGRFDILKETAIEWAFLIKCAERAARKLGLSVTH